MKQTSSSTVIAKGPLAMPRRLLHLGIHELQEFFVLLEALLFSSHSEDAPAIPRRA